MFTSADAYDRFMGRYSLPLARTFADFAQVLSGQDALDVGCGPGALTGELIERLGLPAVSSVDPAEQFVASIRRRYPGLEVRQASAESLPFGDSSFDAALAQLVVHFMSDPPQGLQEMKRVTRPGGIVAACVWDHAGDHGPLSVFWEAVRSLDQSAHDESALPGTSQGDLGRLFVEAGLNEVEEGRLVVEVGHTDFEDWWQPFTLGVGPAGVYVSGLDAEARSELREQCRRLLPSGPFVVAPTAWAARGVA